MSRPTNASGSSQFLPASSQYSSIHDLFPDEGVAIFPLLDFCNLRFTELANQHVCWKPSGIPLQTSWPLKDSAEWLPHRSIDLLCINSDRTAFLNLQRRAFDDSSQTPRGWPTGCPVDVVGTSLFEETPVVFKLTAYRTGYVIVFEICSQFIHFPIS